jgi:hypothetical protein
MYPIRSYVDTAQYIFTAKVLSIENSSVEGKTKAKVLVLKNLKIKNNTFFDTLIIEIGECGPPLRVGEKLLFFAYENNGFLSIPPCTYSDILKRSKRNLRRVRKYLSK